MAERSRTSIVENANFAAVVEPVMHEVHRPHSTKAIRASENFERFIELPCS